MDRPPIKKFIIKGIEIVFFTMAFIVLLLKPTPWKIIGIMTVGFSIFVGIILSIQYLNFERVSSLYKPNKAGRTLIFVVIGLLLISSSILQLFSGRLSILELLNFFVGIGMIIYGLRKKDPNKVEDPKWKLIKTYVPVLIVFILLIFLRFNSDKISAKPEVLIDNEKYVVFNVSQVSNNQVYEETKNIKYIPVYKTSYIDAVDYINKLFLDVGLNNSNILKVEKIKEGYGILFVTTTPPNKNFMDYCKEVSLNFPVNNFIDCKYVRQGENVLLTTSFRVINDTLEARYLATKPQKVS